MIMAWCDDTPTEVHSRCFAITEQGAQTPSGWDFRRSIPRLVTFELALEVD